MNKKLIILLLLGFCLRILFIQAMPFSDGPAFRYWAQYLQNHSLAQLFHLLPNGYTPYPPLYYYILWFLGFIISLLHLESNWFLGEMVMRMPYFISDAITALLIFAVVKKMFNEKNAYISTAFFVFHPASLLTNGWWGQNDAIVLALAIATVYCLVHNKIRLAWLVFILGLLIKVQMIALIPLLIVGSIHKVKSLLLVTPFYLFIGIVPFIPVVMEQGLNWTVAYFRQLPNWYPYTSIYATNIWSLFGFMTPDNIRFFGIPLKLISLGITGLLALNSMVPLFGKKQKPEILFRVALLLFFTFALWSTRVHSRYFIYMLPFLSIFSTRYKVFTLLLSVFIIINLFLQANGIGIDNVISLLTSTFYVRVMIVFGLLLYIYLLKINQFYEKS